MSLNRMGNTPRDHGASSSQSDVASASGSSTVTPSQRDAFELLMKLHVLIQSVKKAPDAKSIAFHFKESQFWLNGRVDSFLELFESFAQFAEKIQAQCSSDMPVLEMRDVLVWRQDWKFGPQREQQRQECLKWDKPSLALIDKLAAQFLGLRERLFAWYSAMIHWVFTQYFPAIELEKAEQLFQIAVDLREMRRLLKAAEEQGRLFIEEGPTAPADHQKWQHCAMSLYRTLILVHTFKHHKVDKDLDDHLGVLDVERQHIKEQMMDAMRRVRETNFSAVLEALNEAWTTLQPERDQLMRLVENISQDEKLPLEAKDFIQQYIQRIVEGRAPRSKRLEIELKDRRYTAKCLKNLKKAARTVKQAGYAFRWMTVLQDAIDTPEAYDVEKHAVACAKYFLGRRRPLLFKDQDALQKNILACLRIIEALPDSSPALQTLISQIDEVPAAADSSQSLSMSYAKRLERPLAFIAHAEDVIFPAAAQAAAAQAQLRQAPLRCYQRETDEALVDRLMPKAIEFLSQAPDEACCQGYEALKRQWMDCISLARASIGDVPDDSGCSNILYRRVGASGELRYVLEKADGREFRTVDLGLSARDLCCLQACGDIPRPRLRPVTSAEYTLTSQAVRAAEAEFSDTLRQHIHAGNVADVLKMMLPKYTLSASMPYSSLSASSMPYSSLWYSLDLDRSHSLESDCLKDEDSPHPSITGQVQLNLPNA